MDFVKKSSFIFFLLLTSFFSFSQNDKNANNDTILVIAQQMPEFPGGVIGLKRFIAQNLDYPLETREAGIQGRIFLRFEVTKTGTIGKVEIQKGIHPILDREAVRVIKSLPKFKPGMQNGNPVSVWYSMPITFRLNSIGEVHNNVPPKFPGGPEALMDYIYAHFIVPPIKADPEMYGEIKVKCEITKKGTVGKVEIIENLNPEMDEEAIRVVKSLPKFEAATSDGKPEKSFIVIPITIIEPVFQSKNNNPEFLHLRKSFAEYINENINYPEEALYAGIKGTVNIRFELTKNGKIENIKIINYLNQLLNKEAIRLIKSLPELKPEKISNKPANVWYVVPIDFKNDKIKIEPAEFPGQDSVLYNYLSENIKQKLGTQIDSESLSVFFEITKEGKIGKKKIFNSFNSHVDSIICEVISTLPDFIPGKVNGNIADTWFYLPFDFGNETYIYVKHMPEFPGGVIALKKFIAYNVKYPPEARNNGIQGTVFLRFEVTKFGTIGKVEIQKGVHPLLDKEAIKVIKSLPKFTPGEQNGKKVNVWYSIPITFKLS